MSPFPKVAKSTVMLFLMYSFVFGSGCSTTVQTPQIEYVPQCEKNYVDDFFLETFGVDTVANALQSCSYGSLGYGGGYDYNLSLKDHTSASVYWSGMGSGGHGYTTYCFYTPSRLVMEASQTKLCENLKYVKDANSLCGDISEFDATNAVIKLCRGGLFTFPTDSGSVISFTQYESRCGTSVTVGSFDCVVEPIDSRNSREELDRTIKSFNS